MTTEQAITELEELLYQCEIGGTQNFIAKFPVTAKTFNALNMAIEALTEKKQREDDRK